MLIGYARVSTQQQDLARQTKALKRARLRRDLFRQGVRQKHGRTARACPRPRRPRHRRRACDCRMGSRHALDVGRLADHQSGDRRRSRRSRFSTAAISTSTTPMGRGFMAMMSAMAEDERLRIIKRTHEGRKIAQAKGVRMGRKPKLTPAPDRGSTAAHRQGRERRATSPRATASASARFRRLAA